VIESGKPKTLEFGVPTRTAVERSALSCGRHDPRVRREGGLSAPRHPQSAEHRTRGAARRIVVTNQDSGDQRLVTQDKVAADPLKDVLEAHLRSGKSGVEETPEGKVFLTVHVPPTRLVVIGAVHIRRRSRRSRRCSAMT
jgi:hypothetical protein